MSTKHSPKLELITAKRKSHNVLRLVGTATEYKDIKNFTIEGTFFAAELANGQRIYTNAPIYFNEWEELEQDEPTEPKEPLVNEPA